MESIIEKIVWSFKVILENLNNFVYVILPGILLLLLALLAAFLIELIIRFLLSITRIDKWLAKTTVVWMFEIIGVKRKPHRFISSTVFWIIFVLLIDVVAKVQGWTMITSSLKEIISFAPLLISSIIIIIVGRFISNIIRRSFFAILSRSKARSAEMLSNLVYYILLAITFTIALSHFGVNTDIITTHITIISGSLLFAFAFAFAIASRSLLRNILSSSYSKNMFKVGQRVSIDKIEGEIIRISTVSVVVKSNRKIHVIPATKFMEEVVEIVG